MRRSGREPYCHCRPASRAVKGTGRKRDRKFAGESALPRRDSGYLSSSKESVLVIRWARKSEFN